MRFHKDYTYGSKFNEHQEEVEKFWSSENDKQLALQEKNQDNKISKSGQEAVKSFLANIDTQNKEFSANINNKFSLSSFDNNKVLILS